MFSWASSIFPLWIFIEVNSFKLRCLLKFFIQLFVGNHLYFYKMKVLPLFIYLRRWLKYEYIRLYVTSFVSHALKCVCLLEMFIYKMSEVSRFSSSYNTNISKEQRIFGIIDNHRAYLSILKYKQERWFIFTCKGTMINTVEKTFITEKMIPLRKTQVEIQNTNYSKRYSHVFIFEILFCIF